MESPFLTAPADNAQMTFFGGLRKRLKASWRAYQYQRIRTAIQTFDSEKHFLSPLFHPVVGESTMRMVRGEIERNKLPFNADSGRPWLCNAGLVRLAAHDAACSNDTEDPSHNGAELPASLRGLRSPDPEAAPAGESPIIFIT